MAEPSEIPAQSNTNNSNFIVTIQPTTKLGGRGTPRRKTRRSSLNSTQSTRHLENKLRPFRSQFHLQDHQELCDVSILYEDGHVEIQRQVHVHSSRPMTIHEIDASETGTQTYHINDLDSTSHEYLLGNFDYSPNDFEPLQTIKSNHSYYQTLQQNQPYSPSSRYYMNYIAYQQNPYAINSYENYSNDIHHVYGNANVPSDDEQQNAEVPIKTAKRKRRRRKHAKAGANEQEASVLETQIPVLQEEEKEGEVITDQHVNEPENENIISTKTKHKRRRVRKSKKTLPLSTDQTDINSLSNSIDQQTHKDILLSPLPPTQHTEDPSEEEEEEEEQQQQQPSMSENNSTPNVLNIIKDDEQKEKENPPTKLLSKTVNNSFNDIPPTDFPHIPTITIDGIGKTEDEYEKIIASVNDDAFTTKISSPILITEKQKDPTEELHTQKANISSASIPHNNTNLKMSNENKTDTQVDIPANNVTEKFLSTSTEILGNKNVPNNQKRRSVSFQIDEKDRRSSSTTEPSDVIKNSPINSKMDLGQTTYDITRVLHISNENNSTLGKHLNPDAPDFKPSDLSSSYHSEFAPGHKLRRATHSDIYDKHHYRSRHSSETYQNLDPSTIPSLLSISPQYVPHHRKSCSTTAPLSISSTSNSWFPQEYSNSSSVASSYQTRSAYQIYKPLMEQPLSTDEDLSSDQQQKYPPKRPRAFSGRIFSPSNQTLSTSRKRSHSGPETPLIPPRTHLTGIHSLTRIMVDILRTIKPIAEENTETNGSLSSEYLMPNFTDNQELNQEVNQITEPENAPNDSNNQMPSTVKSLSPMSIEQTADQVDKEKDSNDNQENQILSLSSIGLNKENLENFSLTNEDASIQITSTIVPEPSIEEEEDEEEKSGNRSRHMVKNSEDKEQPKQPSLTSNSLISPTDSSKYFQSPILQKNLAKKSTEKVEGERIYSTSSLLYMKNYACKNNMQTSSMSILHSNIDDDENGVIRKNKKEKGNLPIDDEYWLRKNKQNEEQMCTITQKDGKNDEEDKEIKPFCFMSPNIDCIGNETKKIDNNEKYIDINQFSHLSTHTNISTSTYDNTERLIEKNNDLKKEKNTTTTFLTMQQQQQQQQQQHVSPLYTMRVTDTTNASAKSSYITTTTSINNNNEKNWDEQCVKAMLDGDKRAEIATANVDDGGEQQRDKKKGEREKREGDVERTLMSTTAREKEKTEERERAKQPNKNTDSVTSFTSEQHSCPSVVRYSIDDSMANRVSYSSYNRNNNHYQNTSSSNNRSSRSTLTTHTYASTNTFNTAPTYTTTPTTGDPRTLHSCYVTSSNYRAPRPSPATSLTRHYREYEPSYPSISRFRTPSSSPFRKTHYLDNSDEEIINEEILEITDLNHYPTLMERWGDDTKTVVRQEGELKFEDFVEFEETEPTVIEEILYELVYSGDKLKSCRQIDRSRSESRNFRKIKKRRTRRKRQANDDSSDLSSQANSRDTSTSGIRSPYFNERVYSPDRSSTPTQSTLSTSWQSTGFIPADKSSFDIPIHNRYDDNYVNQIRVNETDPIRSYTHIQQYPQTRQTTDTQYRTIPSDSIDRRATDLLDEMRQLSNQIGTLINNDNDDNYTSPLISEDRGKTKINLTSTTEDHKTETLLPEDNLNAIKSSEDILSRNKNDLLLTTNQTADDKEQSRTNIIDQTSVEEQFSRKQDTFPEQQHQTSRITTSKYDDSEKEDDEQSSTTGPTALEISKYEQTTGKDTDEDVSFSEYEQNLSKSFTSDQQEQKQSVNIEETDEESHPSFSSLQKQIQDNHEIPSKTVESSAQETQIQQSNTTMDQQKFDTEQIQTIVPSTTTTVSVDRVTSPTTTEQDSSTSESKQDLRSFLNELSTHLLPDLPRSFDDESEDDRSFASETKSTEEPIQQKEQIKTEQDKEEKSSTIIDTITDTISKVQETILGSKEPTKEEFSTSTDSLVNIVEQIQTKTQQGQEQDSISETSGTKLLSKQKPSRDTEDMSEKQQSYVYSQPISLSSSEGQQQIREDIDKSSYLFEQDSNLSTIDSSVEITPTINTLEEDQQQSISRHPPTTIETTEEIKSVDHQSTPQTEEQLSSDSLVDIVRQIDDTPQNIRLSSSHDATETSPTVEQEHQLEINESIPSEPVTANEDQIVHTIETKDLLTESKDEVEPDETNENEQILSSTVPDTDKSSAEKLLNNIRQESTDTQQTVEQITQTTTTTTATTTTDRQPSTHVSEVQKEDESESLPTPSSTPKVTIETTTKETEAERLSTENLTDAVRRIIAASSTSPEDVQKPSIETVTPEIEQVPTAKQEQRTPVDRQEDETLQSTQSSTITEHTTKQIQPESVFEEYITEVVQKVLPSSVIEQLPSLASITETKVKKQEEPSAKPVEVPDVLSTLSTTHIPATTIDQESTTITETTKPEEQTLVHLTKDEVLESSETSTAVRTTDEKTTDEFIPSTEFLPNIVQEILRTPLTVHLPSTETEIETTSSTVQSSDADANKAVSDQPPIEEVSTDETKTQVLLPVTTTTTTVTQDSTNTDTQQPTLSSSFDYPTEQSTSLVEQEQEKPSGSILDNIVQQVKDVWEDLTTTTATTTTTEKEEKEELASALSTDETEALVREKTPEDLAERISTDAIIDAVHEIISQPVTSEQPSTKHEKIEQEEEEEEAEHLSTEALTSAVRQIIAASDSTEQPVMKVITTTTTTVAEEVPFAAKQPLIEKKKEDEKSPTESLDELVNPIHITPVFHPAPYSDNETAQQEDKTDEVEAERLATEALTSAVRQIIATSVSTKEESVAPVELNEEKFTTTEQPLMEKRKEDEKLSSESSNELGSSSATIPNFYQLRSTEADAIKTETQQNTANEVEAERLATEALTSAVPQIIAAPAATEQKCFASTEQPLMKAVTITTTTVTEEPLVEKKTEDEELPSELSNEAVSSIVTKPDFYQLQSTETDAVTTETTQQDTINEMEAERLVTEALALAVQQIIAVPVSTEQKSFTTIESNEDKITTSEQPVMKVVTTTTVVEETQSDAEQPLTKKNKEAEQLSTDSLGAIIHQILATPVSVHLPSLESTTETSITSTEIPTEKSSEIETVQETSLEEQPLSTENVSKDTEADDVSSEALTETVRQILATPLAVHLPSIESSSEKVIEQTEELKLTADETTEQPKSTQEESDAKQADHLSTDGLSEAVRQILATPLTVHLPSVDVKSDSTEGLNQPTEVVTDELPAMQQTTENDQVTLTEKPVLEKTITTTITETKQLSGDIGETNDIESTSTDSLTETVRQILNTPVYVHLPSVEQTVEAISSTEEQVDKPSSDVTTIDELLFQSTPVTEEVRSEVDTTFTDTDTKKQIVLEEHSLPSTEVSKQETEQIVLPNLTEAVQKVLPSTLVYQLPSLTSTSEIPTPVLQQTARKDEAEQQQEPVDNESDKTLQSTQPSTIIETAQQTTTTEHTTKLSQPEPVSTEYLTEVVQKVLPSTLIEQLPSLASTTETKVKQEDVHKEPESVDIQNDQTIPSTVTDISTTGIEQETVQPENELSAETPTETMLQAENVPDLPKTEEVPADKTQTSTKTELLLPVTTTTTTDTQQPTLSSSFDYPTEQSTSLVEQEQEKPSGSILDNIVQQVKDVWEDLTTTTATTTTTEKEEKEELASALSTDETEALVREKTPEDLAERISTDAIIDAVHEIISQPVTSEQPSTKHEKIEQEEEEEAEHLSTEALTSAVRQIIAASTLGESSEHERITSSIEETSSEVEQPLVENKEEDESESSKIENIEKQSDSSTSSANVEKTTVTISIQPQCDESVKEEIVRTETSLSENEHTPLQSIGTDVTEELEKESPVQDDTSSTELQSVSSESDILLRRTVSSESVPGSEDKSLHEEDDQSVSSSLYATAHNLVTDAIVDACSILTESIPEKTEDQSLQSPLPLDDVPEKVDDDKKLTVESIPESQDDTVNLSGLTNVVHGLLNMENTTSTQSTVPRDENKLIVSDKPNFDSQLNTDELTNILDAKSKTLSAEIPSTEESKFIDKTFIQRASAVTPTLQVNDTNIDVKETEPLTFFVPGTPTPSETNFQELYKNRHFITSTAEESVLEFSPVSREDSVQSTVQTQEKKNVPESPLAYFELQEQRHTLMSPQQSVNDKEEEAQSTSLTAWTAVPPVLDLETIVKKEEKSDINLDDQAYEAAKRFDLSSPSVISNLPSKDYYQVFGVSEDVANTMDNITKEVVRKLSEESEHETQLTTAQETVQVEENAPISDNIKRITEALDALESDILAESVVTQANELSADDQNRNVSLVDDIKETLEGHSIIVPTKDELLDEDLLPRTTEEIIASNNEIESRYTTLLDHIDSLEKPLLDVQTSSLTSSENETIPIEINQQTDDTLLKDATKTTLASDTTDVDQPLEESNVNAHGLVQTMEQILAAPVRTVIHPYEKFVQEQSPSALDLEKTLEQMLATTQYPTSYAKLPAPVDKITLSSEQVDAPRVDEEKVPTKETESSGILDKTTSLARNIVSSITDVLPLSSTSEETNTSDEILTKEEASTDQHEKLQEAVSLVPGYFSSSDVYHAYKQPIAPIVEAEDTSSLTDKASSIAKSVISSVTEILPSSKTTEETTEDLVEQQQTPSTTSLLDKIKDAFSSTFQSTTTDVENEQEISVSSPVPGYFSSSDVYHAYKQPIEPVVEAEDTSSLTDKASSIAKSVISSVTEILPSSKITEETTEDHVEQQQTPSTTSLLDKIKDAFSSTFQSTTTDVENEQEISVSSPVPGYFSSSDVYHAYKQPIEPVVEAEDTSSLTDKASSIAKSVISSVTEILPSSKITEETTEDHVEQQQTPSTTSLLDKIKDAFSSTFQSTTTDVENEQEISVSSPVPGYFSSSDVYHAYKQPIEPVVEAEDTSSLTDKASSIAKSVISSVTEILPSSKITEETTEDHVEQQQTPSTTSLLDKIKDAFSSTFQSTTTDVENEQEISVSSPVPGYFSSSDVYHAYKPPIEPVVKEDDSIELFNKATSIVSDIISSATNLLPTYKTNKETSLFSDTSSSSEPDNSSQETVVYTELISFNEEVRSTIAETEDMFELDNEEQAPSTRDLLETMKTVLPSSLRTTVTDTTSSINDVSTIVTEKVEEVEQQQTPSTSNLLKILKTIVPSSLLTSSTESITSDEYATATENENKVPVLNATFEDVSSNDVSSADKEPIEVTIEEKESTGIADQAKSMASSIISSVTHFLPSTSKTEEQTTTYSSIFSDEEKTESEFETPIDTTSDISESTISYQDEEITEPPSSTGLLEIMKHFIPSGIRREASIDTKVEEQIPTIIETKATTTVTDQYPLENAPLTIADQTSADTTDIDISHTETGSSEQVEEEKPAVSMISRLTSVVTDTISAVQHAFPTSVTPSTDVHDQSETPTTGEQEHHTFLERIVQAASNIKDTITHLGTSDNQPTTDDSFTTVLNESFEEPSVYFDVDEQKDTLIETSKEILAAPLQSAIDTYEKLVSSEDVEQESSSASETPTKTITTDYPQMTSPTSTSEEAKPSQELQVIGDDYPWYPSHYTIADADDNLADLHQKLSYTIQQLDQRSTSTNVEFQPEPHESATLPDYDRKALVDTQDTRDKVHELAQLSRALTIPSQNEQEDDKVEEEFPIVQHLEHVPSSTLSEKTTTTTVVHGQPSTTETTTTSSTSSSEKKKSKKHKKDKKETTLFDSPASTIQTQETEKPIETKDLGLLPSSSEKEVKSELAEANIEEQSVEPVSTSILSEIEENRQVDDDKNDSTSSDASQLLSSTSAALPDDNKIDNQTIVETTTTTTETVTTVASTDADHEPAEISETRPTSASKKKKKTKQKSAEHETVVESEVLSTTSVVEEPLPSTVIKTETISVRPKTVVSPKPEQAEEEDNEEFQIVSYRKHFPSVAVPEKPPSPSSSMKTSKQSATSDKDRKTTTADTQATVTQKKPKKDKKETTKLDISFSSPSTDTDVTSSSGTSINKTKQTGKKSTDEQKSSDDTTKSQIPISSLVASTSVPPLIIEESVEKPSQEILQSRPPTASTFRIKAFTSPEEEEEDDNEGFQVVHYRKRISSAPRLDKSLPPLPTKPSYRHNVGRDTNLRPTVIHGRRGSETRSMPRSTTVGQISSEKRQQTGSKQGRPPMSPRSTPHSTAPRDTQPMSSSDSENKYSKPAKSSIIEQPQRYSDTAIRSLITEQHEPFNTQYSSILSSVPQQSLDEKSKNETTQTTTEQLSASASSLVDRSVQQIIDEYHVPTSEEIKTSAQQSSFKEVLPVAVITATTTKKAPLTEEEDEDGFRVVRYRKHTPSSPTIASKQASFGYGSEKKSSTTHRKQSSSPSIGTSTTGASQTTIPKKKPPRPKKSKEELVTSRSPRSVELLSSSTTDTDFASSSIEDFKNQMNLQSTRPIVESPITTEETSSHHPENEVTKTRTNLTENVPKQPQIDEQPIESATSPVVTSADTSEDASKKPKKKHKRSKRELVGSELSTPSDEVPSISETLSTTRTISTTSLTQPVATDLPPISSQIEETADKVTTAEDTVPPLASPVESRTAVEDEESKTTTSKKPSKRRKKKPHITEKESEGEENILNSSSTSTTDKDSSSASIPLAVKEITVESTTKSRLTSDDDRQESERTVTQSKKKKSKPTEQTVSSSFQSSAQSQTSTIFPEKVTDVQFKFKKDGDLTVTSQSSLERSPAEWGTVKFPSEEPKLLTTEQVTVEQEPINKSTTNLTSQSDTEVKAETSRKSLSSSETGVEGDLDAYRDESGRLRRKKSRKTTTTSVKSEETTSVVPEPSTTEEHKLDQQTIREHWADVLASPVPTTDEEQKEQPNLIQEEQLIDEEDTSETNSKLDSFLPDYIREQIKTASSPRSMSFTDDRFKSSSIEVSTVIAQSTSTDTSESESRKQVREFPDPELYSRENSDLQSTTNQTESDTMLTTSATSAETATRKKKQRPKMLKKDIEATRLLTHEFDDSPLTITSIRQPSPVKQPTEDETKTDESFLSSIREQFSSVISNISDSLTSALAAEEPTTTITTKTKEEQLDEPVPSSNETSTATTSTTTTTTVSTRKSTRSPRKRSKRDSGPDYENLTLQLSSDLERSSADRKDASTSSSSAEQSPSESAKVETHKHQSRQRTSSGRQIVYSEEENEQQAILADDEEDEDVHAKPLVGTTSVSTSSDSSNEKQDSTSTTLSKRRQHKKNSGSEEIESIPQVSEVSNVEQEEPTVEQQTTTTRTSEPLRPVQGFHSFTPNKYQYNQYEEGPAVPSEQSQPLAAETYAKDEVLSRGFNLWLQKGKDDDQETSPTSNKEKEVSSTAVSGLTRAMQSLIIQPVETENEDEEDDSWNGPHAKKPTYTTGIRIEKRIHENSGYNINHPRTTASAPAWIRAPSEDRSNQDDPSSKFDPDDDEEENSIEDISDKQSLPSHPINTQLSTTEERQAHLNTLADLNFQSTTSKLSISSASSASSPKWNATTPRNADEINQQQTSFTEDDVQRCLGENFYRESLAINTLPTEQRTLTSLDELVLKPSELLSDDDDSTANNNQQRNRNNNNSNPSVHFDEWAHFLEQQNDQKSFFTSTSNASSTEQSLSTSPECSYARVIDDDTLVSDVNRSNLIGYVQHFYENDRQRYGDFTSLNDNSPVSETPIQQPRTTLSTDSEQQNLYHNRPSQTFQRWRNQMSRDRDDSNTNQTSLENQNDDEIVISHSNAGLSRRVRPSS